MRGAPSSRVHATPPHATSFRDPKAQNPAERKRELLAALQRMETFFDAAPTTAPSALFRFAFSPVLRALRLADRDTDLELVDARAARFYVVAKALWSAIVAWGLMIASSFVS